MSKLSCIIPSRSERFLVPTVNSIFEKATGPIEVIVVIDGGEWPNPQPLPQRDNLIVIRHPESLGTRRSINDGVVVASGEFILKCDAHVLFDEGFDEKLKATCNENTVVVPRRKRLDAENWQVEETSRPDCDYEYIQWHPTDFGGRAHNITRWQERNADASLKEVIIDDLMVFQASCWMMRRDYFRSLDLMDEATYGKTQNEGEEIAFKCWLSGGRVIINKATWYAHLWKGNRYSRDYKFEADDLQRGTRGVQLWLTNCAWEKQRELFAWLIDKFWPVPGWPENWRELVSPLPVPTRKETNERSHGRTDSKGDADAAGASLHDLDEQDAGSSQLSTARAPAFAGSVLSKDIYSLAQITLRRILGKFNLNTLADYSKHTMPIGLRLNRRQLAELFAELGLDRGAEIGTAEGRFAQTLLNANPRLRLFCIDAWQSYEGYKDYTQQRTLDDLYEHAKTRLAGYAGVTLIKGFSPDAASDYLPNELDFVYIDACHQYEHVVADIAAWLPKIRSGGIIAGHDYSHPKGKQFGVVEAVTGWTNAYAIAPWFILKGEYEAVGDRSHSWLWVKA